MRLHDFALQFRVWLWGINPPIWRRIIVSPDLNFAELHEALQACFGWQNSHMHQFTVGGLVLGAPEFEDGGLGQRRVLDAADLALRDLDFHRIKNPYFLYEYDFGDGWVHQLDLETHVRVDNPEKKVHLLAGERSGPPEDSGGPHSYDEFVASLNNKDHPEHRSNRKWVGKSFNPEAFDRDKVQKSVDLALRRARGSYRFRSEG